MLLPSEAFALKTQGFSRPKGIVVNICVAFTAPISLLLITAQILSGYLLLPHSAMSLWGAGPTSGSRSETWCISASGSQLKVILSPEDFWQSDCSLHLVGRCWGSIMHRATTPQQRIIQPKRSKVLGLRKLDLSHQIIPNSLSLWLIQNWARGLTWVAGNGCRGDSRIP